MKSLETVLQRTDSVARIFFLAGALALGALFLYTFGDIAGRFLFNSPLWGTLELSEYLLVAIAFLALSGIDGLSLLISRLEVRVLRSSLSSSGLFNNAAK